MDIERKIKIEPPRLEGYINRLVAINELIKNLPGYDKNSIIKVELSAQTADGIFNMIDDIGHEISGYMENDFAKRMDKAVEDLEKVSEGLTAEK